MARDRYQKILSFVNMNATEEKKLWEVNLDKIHNLLAKEGQSYRDVAQILSDEYETGINYGKIYSYFKQNAYKYPPLPDKPKAGRAKKKNDNVF